LCCSESERSSSSTGTGNDSAAGSVTTDLRGSDALYGQFTSGALKLLAGQRTDTSSAHHQSLVLSALYKRLS
jgi:hypothetical protein